MDYFIVLAIAITAGSALLLLAGLVEIDMKESDE